MYFTRATIHSAATRLIYSLERKQTTWPTVLRKAEEGTRVVMHTDHVFIQNGGRAEKPTVAAESYAPQMFVRFVVHTPLAKQANKPSRTALVWLSPSLARSFVGDFGRM